jgi:three-Cys-motif partner protein
MSAKDELAPYLNREHALVKHKLFERYFKRFIMIIGISRSKMAYIDAFAGPWLSSEEGYGDTSFGRAINAIETCSISLAKQHNKRPRFRCLLIEAEEPAFSELNEFAKKANKATATVEARNRRFEDCVEEITAWIKPGEKTFVLIDPKAYRGLISPRVLSPLLKNPDVEVLINYMWQFINLAIGHGRSNEKHDANLKDLFGSDYLDLSNLPPGEKETALIRKYKKRLVEESDTHGETRARAAAFPVEYANRDGTKYYLVYLTHNHRGLIAFGEASDEAIEDQKEIQIVVGQSKREAKTGVSDLFGGMSEPAITTEARESVWTEMLPTRGSSIVVNSELWADMLEKNDSLPRELQAGLKKLIDKNVVEVVGATTRRRKNFVNWKNSEVVRRIK